MHQLSLENIIGILKEFVREKGAALYIILVGGLALQHYGMKDRSTIDIDAEVKGGIEDLFNFLKLKGIPSDLGEDLSGWSVVAMPSGYRERAITRSPKDTTVFVFRKSVEIFAKKLKKRRI